MDPNRGRELEQAQRDAERGAELFLLLLTSFLVGLVVGAAVTFSMIPAILGGR